MERFGQHLTGYLGQESCPASQDYTVLRSGSAALGELGKAALSPDAGSPHPAHGLVKRAKAGFQPPRSPRPSPWAVHNLSIMCHHFFPVALDSDPSGSPWGLGPVGWVCDLPPLHLRQSLWGTKHVPTHTTIPLVQCPCSNAAIRGPP